MIPLKTYGDFPRQELQPYIKRVCELVGPRVLAVVAYGSALSQVTKSSTSLPDFFVIVEDYASFYSLKFHAFLNSFLPPNIYHFTMPDQDETTKYCVVSLSRLQREVTLPSDMYLVGRFSKKMAIAWQREETFVETLSKVQERAILTVARKTLALMPPTFTLESFILKALSLSYLGDVRVEASNKIQKLYDADRGFYQTCFSQALSTLPCKTEGTEIYVRTCSSSANTIDATWVRFFLFVSRVRARLRWPKSMFTASDWLEYVIKKIERTQGITIDLTAREKKLWFIYGWKYFLLLKKKNLIK